uniref:CCHC-type domain-containing protein n=1 Tax=Oryza meridionalis TaxID=40149 RepID=A0A0E0EN94_9ORYZ
MDQPTPRHKNPSNLQGLQNMGIKQPMLLFEEPPQASSDKERVQSSLKPEDYTIGLNHLKQYPANGSCHLTTARRKANVTCFGCDCTQDTNEEQETRPSQISPEEDEAQEPSKELLKVKACSCCGEIGHYGSNCVTQCPYCNEDHPVGECPTTKITCFLCERTDHVSQDCQLSPLLTKTAKVQRVTLRFAHQLMKSGSRKGPGFSSFD